MEKNTQKKGISRERKEKREWVKIKKPLKVQKKKVELHREIQDG